MILLSVIMALGLAGILKENTLGTLLGGIAGYVLAQGVGRAAAREVSRERERKQDPLT
jgi:membrane protein YqaA with SNARE-associated domain